MLSASREKRHILDKIEFIVYLYMFYTLETEFIKSVACPSARCICTGTGTDHHKIRRMGFTHHHPVYFTLDLSYYLGRAYLSTRVAKHQLSPDF